MKKIISLCLVSAMLLTVFAVPAAAASTTYYLKADDFAKNPGTWTVADPQVDSYFKVLRGLTGGGETAPAMASFSLEEAGEYHVWVHSHDITGGTRNFRVGVNGQMFGTLLGKNGNGWAWEKAGTISLKAGVNTFYVQDITQYYARVDAFCLTTDADFVPPAEKAEIEKGFNKNHASVADTPKEAASVELTVIESGEEAQKPTTSTEQGMPKVAPDDADRAPSVYTLKDDKDYFMISPAQFMDNNNGWDFQTDSLAQLGGPYFNGGGKTDQTASMELVIPKTDIYTIWARTKDASSNAGSRHITLSIDDAAMTNKVGVHGIDGWEWESAGKIELTGGSHTLSVAHTGAYGRLDMILITNDADFTPPWENSILAGWLQNDLYDASAIVPDTSVDANRPNSEIAVRFNGEYMQFDVDPVMINDRTMVPMRAIFEALGVKVSWKESTQTASGNRNGRVVSVTIDSNKARINGEIVEIDQSAVLLNDRTMVPLRFISEAYGATVSWDEATQTVSIVADAVPEAILLMPQNFSKLGTWTYSIDLIMGVTTGYREDLEPAEASFSVSNAGDYNVWVYAKDYATNQQGSRYFATEVDGVRSDTVFGAHGKEGFSWQKAGNYHLTSGLHTVSVIDTSGFYARCGGVFVTNDLDYVPSDDMNEVQKVASAYDPFADCYPDPYPAWAKQEWPVLKSESIENESSKITFYLVNGPQGAFVQDEIFEKYNGQWVQIKKKTEESGLFLMAAYKSEYAGNDVDANYNSHLFTQTLLVDGEELASNLNTYFKAGNGMHMLATDFEKTADGKIVLSYDNEYTTAKTTYSFDALSADIRVDLDATFKQDGAYSFLLFSGDGVTEDQYETVTAPLLFAKHALPKKDILVAENNMFTPMSTFYYTADNNSKTPGMELTSGFIIDPSVVQQDFVYPETSTYGIMFRTMDELVRPQITAPLFGSEGANKKAGESFHFAYRIVNDFNSWEDTFTRAAEEVYNYTDLRTNYYTSINEAIYNTIDLLKDDFYGGWDAKGMGNYNMEKTNWVSISNPQAFGQVYLWTDDEEFLETRLIPSIASLLTRGGYHLTIQSDGDTSFVSSSLGKENPYFGTAVYGGLYEMSQGRIPYLMEYAINGSKVDNIESNIARYKYTGDESYKKAVIQAADDYLENNPNTGLNREKHFVDVFVYVDYIIMVDNFLNAYEFTGDQKYLDAAKDAAYLLATGTWTTGYQNDYATTDYYIDPDKVYERPTTADSAGFFWHGDFQWRPGNAVIGEYQTTRGMPKVEAETVPGWLPARAGLGTEHVRTPGHGNVITMNNWTGAFLRLAEYTDDDFFATMSHNATIGRFGTYPGYYIDRYITHQMKPEYPYEGPDYTSIYWHHIPVFLGMLQDYIMNSAWQRSEGNIEFESTFQSGYAYFSNYCYGHKPGKFYDEDGMYLWLDRGIIDTNDNVNLDYIIGRKDGALAIALLNEAQEPLTETVTLGEKIEGGTTYNGTATLYDAAGNASEIEVVNGAFTVTVPVRGIQTVVIKTDAVQKPSWAQDYTYSNALGETVATHDNGKGYLLQFNDDAYYAYLYTDERAESTKSVTFTYTVDGKSTSKTIDKWPFETIIKVDDVTKPISYTVSVTTADGKKKNAGGGTLKTLKQTQTVPEMKDKNEKITFTPFDLNCIFQGIGGGLRLVITKDNFPFEPTTDSLKGMRVKGTLKGLDGNKDLTLDTVVQSNEMRADGNILLVVAATEEVPPANYNNNNAVTHEFQIKLYPKE